MCSRLLDEDEAEMTKCGDCGGDGDCGPSVQRDPLRKGKTDPLNSNAEVKCKKCGEKDAVVWLRDNDTYCPSCLQLSVNHKFRSCLGKSRLMRSGERVLMAFSGGPSSSLMLMLTKLGLAESSHKRLRFVPLVIYVDETAIFDSGDSFRKENFRIIASYVRGCGFPLFVTSLEKALRPRSDSLYAEVVCDKTENEFSYDVIDEEVSSLKELFVSVRSVTCKEDLLVKLRQRLLRDVARRLNCTKVFVGDSETRIAVRVLSDIAQGKGQHISSNCGFADNCDENVLILRPMREILAKEVSYLVNMKQIPCVIPKTFATKHDASVSIQHLTESFVFGLQDEFPSTVSTIFRTGDKMGSSSNRFESKKGNIESIEGENRKCNLCLVPLDQKVLRNCSEESSNHLQKRDFAQSLCYSCEIIANETPDLKALPLRLGDDAARNSST